MLPRVARPRIVAGLAGLRDGIEFPDLLSGADVERGDPAIDAVFVRRRPEDDFVLDDERRDIELKALLPVDERPVPDRLAGLRVDRNQVPVVRGPEQAISRRSRGPSRPSSTHFDSGGTRYRKVQKLRPVAASSATTSLFWTA